jgi:hypothetical protein
VTPMTQTWRLAALDRRLRVVTQAPLDRHGADALALGWTPGARMIERLTPHGWARLGRVMGQDVQMPPAARAASIVAVAVLNPAGTAVAFSGLTGDAPAQEGDGVNARIPDTARG